MSETNKTCFPNKSNVIGCEILFILNELLLDKQPFFLMKLREVDELSNGYFACKRLDSSNAINNDGSLTVLAG